MSTNRTSPERITALEVRMANVEETTSAIRQEQSHITAKLDDLLELRNKGAGAFWLATSLAGVGALTILANLFHNLLAWLIPASTH